MSRKKPLVRGKEKELEEFKIEVAKDMIMENRNLSKELSIGNTSSKAINEMSTAGNIGGQMVKKMIKDIENKMADKYK
ncbi:small, acid-soluble spore protein, alpha/beta type [Clostridium niameyense]|uniref:Small, acid-soluble spore protein, alpha/beta type n=1 Tax=Clostridium niameyense TaxID=1622073 RepID=A0A6M0R9Q4_9CLOT|nr:small, acid-soluble spore protein, alpha/beta type [Clostridium niameyense]NEZ46963.1 small, acid-soluble spore protein, alpha/beta type [Clostridium niameyense]